MAESSPAMIASLDGEAGRGPGVVVGLPHTYPFEASGFLNGVFAHSLEFDDTNIAAALHPGAPVIAAALAAAQAQSASGPAFLAALAAGYEVSCRLGVALGTGTFSRGFHPTGVEGVFGAVAAVASLCGFEAAEMTSAFGIAGSMVAGSTQYLHCGSWNKRLHAGLAARNGIFATRLQSAGIIGASRAFEGEHGVVHAYTDTPRPDALAQDLGTAWVLKSTGIKPYPSCRLAHGAIDAALELRRGLGGADPAPDASISIRLNSTDSTIIGGTERIKFEPATTVDGQFSIYFQVAASLLYGLPDWSVYDHLADPRVLALARRITAVPDDDVAHAGAVVTLHSADRPDAVVSIETPSGERGIDLPWDVIERKFRSLATTTFEKSKLSTIVDAVRGLPNGGAVAALVAELQAGAPAHVLKGVH
jgi:2-methylcitrate dehydratase PrpD